MYEWLIITSVIMGIYVDYLYSSVLVNLPNNNVCFVDCTQDEKELAENNCCPVHLKPCVPRKEDNYFFALSKYQHKLEELLTRNPNFVRPSHRLHEVRRYPL